MYKYLISIYVYIYILWIIMESYGNMLTVSPIGDDPFLSFSIQCLILHSSYLAWILSATAVNHDEPMKQERSPSTWDEQQHKHREGGRAISFNIIWYYVMPKTLCQCALQHIAPRFRTSSWLFSHRQNISSHFWNNLVAETFFVKLSQCYSWKSQDVALLQPLRFNACRSHMGAVTAARLEESSRAFHRPKVATGDIEDKTPVDPKSDCRSSYVDSRCCSSCRCWT